MFKKLYDTNMTVILNTTKSKRLALRFDGNLQAIRYKTEFEDGEATLANISRSGAALKTATLPLAIDEKILLSVALYESEAPLEVQAVVVRSDKDTFSVQFRGVDEKTKSDILKSFARKIRVKGD